MTSRAKVLRFLPSDLRVAARRGHRSSSVDARPFCRRRRRFEMLRSMSSVSSVSSATGPRASYSLSGTRPTRCARLVCAHPSRARLPSSPRPRVSFALSKCRIDDAWLRGTVWEGRRCLATLVLADPPSLRGRRKRASQDSPPRSAPAGLGFLASVIAAPLRHLSRTAKSRLLLSAGLPPDDNDGSQPLSIDAARAADVATIPRH